MIEIAGTPLNHPSELSAAALAVLALIPNGRAWIQWAAADRAVKLSVLDEAALLTTVQTGLTGSPLLLLRRLGKRVGPGRLVSLAPDALQSLLRREAGDDTSVVEQQARRALAEAGLVTFDDLAAGQKFLADLGIADAPIFRGTTLAEQCALTELVRASSSEAAMRDDLQREAAAFAVARTAAVLPFTDLYKAYVTVAAKYDLLAGTPEVRAAKAQQTLDTLYPLLFGALDSPRIAAPTGPAELTRQLRAFISSGRTLGFSRLSSGVLQFVQHTKFLDETGEHARSFVDAFMREAQGFVAGAPLVAARLGQDGVSCIYTQRAGGKEAELALDEAGGLTLRTFRLSATPAATPAQSAGAAA